MKIIIFWVRSRLKKAIIKIYNTRKTTPKLIKKIFMKGFNCDFPIQKRVNNNLKAFI